MLSSVLALLMDLELYISIPLSSGLSLDLGGQLMQVREFVSATANCLVSVASMLWSCVEILFASVGII